MSESKTLGWKLFQRFCFLGMSLGSEIHSVCG